MMLKFVPYVLKTLWRHRARTLLTLSGSAVALLVFCFVEAVGEGMHNLQNQKRAQQSLVVFQANKFCPATSQLPQRYADKLASVQGVREVVPIRVFTNNCRASLDVVVFYGLPAKQVRRVRDFRLVAGDWSEFEKNRDAAIVGKALAERRNLRVGGKFTVGEVTVTIAGTYTSRDAAEENYAYAHLDLLQRTKGDNQVGTVTQLEILLANDVDPDEKCKEIDALLREEKAVATTTRAKGAFQARSLGDLQELIRLMGYLGYTCIGLMLVLVTTTTVMSVEDRVKEHAVLQSIGFSPLRVFTLVLSESVFLSLVGGLIGVGAALAILGFGNFALGAEAVAIAFRPSPTIAVTGVLVALVTGSVAGIAPAWHAARTEIVPALRQA